ncbi:cytochrome P450 [Streptomyces sp. NPDC059766]|uniref:cytochrome P450 n=1 Tax=Streptomyces sp. NPDC059766 TaxID=3346940 RepID=UPI00365FF0A0
MDTALINHFVEHFDHHDPRLHGDPSALWNVFLDKEPVAWSDVYGGFWLVNDYDSARFVLQNADVFTNTVSINVPPSGHDTPKMVPIEMDPPEHTKYRRIMAPAFSPQSINKLEPRIRELCNMLIDTFIDKGGCEFVRDFAAPLPTTLFTQIMGLPIEDVEKFYRWKNIINHEGRSSNDMDAVAKAAREVIAYLKEIFDARRENPQDDIATQLVQAQLDGDAIPEEDMLSMGFLLFLGGLDTVTAALGFAFGHLATTPEHRDLLIREPELIPSAVEEFLRRDAVILPGRVATQDVELQGKQIKAGDLLLVNTVAANRDFREFDRPAEFQLDREANRHLTFGVGPHRCVGSHLARIELTVAIEEFLRRVPDFRLAEGATLARHMNQVVAFEDVQLAWG